jgi:acid phosphatase
MSDTIGFLFFGDWGYMGDDQLSVAQAMGTYADDWRNDVEFVLAMGDNFYKNDDFKTHNGVYDTSDSQWDYLYRNVYTHQSLQIPWYATLGNHDYHGNPEAQIDFYKSKKDPRWVMRDHCYNQRWYLNGAKDPLLEIVFIDTTILSPTIIPETSKGGKYEASKEDIAKQYAMVEKMLSQSKATWLFVSGHYTSKHLLAFTHRSLLTRTVQSTHVMARITI